MISPFFFGFWGWLSFSVFKQSLSNNQLIWLVSYSDFQDKMSSEGEGYSFSLALTRRGRAESAEKKGCERERERERETILYFFPEIATCQVINK